VAGAASLEGIYGSPSPELVPGFVKPVRLSPLVPGAAAIDEAPGGAFARLVVAAPPGSLERRFVLAHALRALAPGGELTALAPKAKGGARLRAELEAFGCTVQESARRHHRICVSPRPETTVGLEDAIEAGGPRWLPDLEVWSQPGVFSWDRLDPGTALLIASEPHLAGRGADLGCGIGVLARAALAREAITELFLVDIDRRAVAAAERNLADRRAIFLHADVRRLPPVIAGLDFVIMNPPFHRDGGKDLGLGLAFIAAAAGVLKPGGLCRLVANQALPYEAALREHFSVVTPLGQSGGYKLCEARR